MEIKVIEGKKYFFVKYDKEYVVNQLKEMRDSYENYYVEYGFILESGGSYLSKEEYEKNYDQMIEFAESISEEKLEDILKEFPRKKSGWLNLRNVEYLYRCNNTQYISEWHNTWIYQTLKVKAKDDMTLEVFLYEMVDTPA